MKNIFLTLSIGVMLLGLGVSTVYAQTKDYVPLEPLPGLQDASKVNFAQFLGLIFNLLLIAGALLAVGTLVYAGISYILSEAFETKGEARNRMVAALYGLVILLGAWLMLNTVNPALLNFDLSSIGTRGGGGINTNPNPNGSGGNTPVSTSTQTVTPMSGVKKGTFSGGTQTAGVQNQACGSSASCVMLDKYVLFDPNSANDATRKKEVSDYTKWCTGPHEDSQALTAKRGSAQMFQGELLGESGLLGLACVLK